MIKVPRMPHNIKGLDVIPMKRLPLLFAATVMFTFGSGVPGWAQIFYPPPYRYAVTVDASVRIEATPKDAEVYVDGFYAGIVDDFDGVFQRLNIEPGQHEIVLYLEGYHAVHQRVYLMPNKTFHMKERLERLAAGEAGEARPAPLPQAVQVGPQGLPEGQPRPLPGGGPGRGGRRGPLPPTNRPQDGPGAGGPPSAQTAAGTLTIQLQPADADILIDGQPWPAAQRGERFVVDVAEGRHTVQVRKPGYVGFLTEVDVRRGETTPLNISLRAQP